MKMERWSERPTIGEIKDGWQVLSFTPVLSRYDSSNKNKIIVCEGYTVLLKKV